MRRALRFLRRLFLAFLVCTGLVFVVAFAFVLSSLRGNATFPADCGVVFGAAVQPLRDGSGRVIASQAGPAILRRVQTAADLYRQGLLKEIFLTGGKGEGMRLSEAEVMRRVALRDGVKAQSVILESQSRSTRENIAFTKPLTGSCVSIVAISDDYHLARITLLAWENHWSIRTTPSSTRAPAAFEAWSIAREVAGIVYESLYPLLGSFKVQS